MRLGTFLFVINVLLITNYICHAQTVSTDNTLKKSILVTDIKKYTHPKLNMTVIGCDIELPIGRWQISNSSSLKEFRQIQFNPLRIKVPIKTGGRYDQYETQKVLKRSVPGIRYVFWNLQKYAKKHGNIGPSKIEDMDEKQRTEINRRPGYIPMNSDVSPPFYFIVPNVTINLKDKDLKTQPLVLELHPYIDDNKHYVLYNNGTVKRVEIGQGLVERYHLTIEPVTKYEADNKEIHNSVIYQFRALSASKLNNPVTFELFDTRSSNSIEINFNTTKMVLGDDNLFDEWVKARAFQWASMLSSFPSNIYLTWLNQMKEIYGTDYAMDSNSFISQLHRQQRGRTTSIFNLLGGRAAIEETLQMQNLNVNNRNEAQPGQEIPINTIEGVTVKSHPFKSILEEQKVNELELANYVPHDRLFIYFSRPQDLSRYLEKGVEYIYQSGSDIRGNAINYHMKERYYQRLGLNETWVEKFLKSGVVNEIAVVLPDLFLIDNTDISIIAKVPQLKLIKPLLNLLTLKSLKKGTITAVNTPNDQQSFWCIYENLLIISSYKSEVENILKMVKNNGQESLGKSAEFRYMLTQLPITSQTRVYTYISDPFIRRLVGPKVKISQFRRLQEKARLEAITSGAFLYSLDGHPDKPTLSNLSQLGYLRSDINKDNYTLKNNYQAVSSEYGYLTDLKTILEMNIQSVTQEEQKAYQNYMDNYSQFWRQFFDPIALRFDKINTKEWIMEVFILPLIDSSIYETLREIFNAHDSNTTFKVPELDPKPVLSLSANISENSWVKVITIFDFLKSFIGADSAIFDQFGPSFHFILLDGDPIINLGSGDILSSFGGNSSQFLRSGEAFWIPIAFTMLTRPAKIMIELKDTNQTLQFLRETSFANISDESRRDTHVEFVQVDNKDQWHLNINLFNVLNLRFGLQVKDNFLVLSNLPWSKQENISLKDEKYLNSVLLQLNPGSANQQLPGLFHSALSRMGESNRKSITYLTPLLELNKGDIEKSLQNHRLLFGFTPLHAGDGEWVWTDNQLKSTTFGGVWSKKHPAYKSGDRNFGLLRHFRNLFLSMQFEQDGLRSQIRWIANE